MSTEPARQRQAQEREQTEPTERNGPIPLVVAITTLVVVLAGVVYILLSEPFGRADLGDRRTLTDLRPSTAAAPQGADGAQLFSAHCAACHQATGQGLPGVFPPLDRSEWVNGDERVLANILLYGISGEIAVQGQAYKGSMPSFAKLNDAELAAILSHVRSSWSNRAAPVLADALGRERSASPRTTPFASGNEIRALVAKAP